METYVAATNPTSDLNIGRWGPDKNVFGESRIQPWLPSPNPELIHGRGREYAHGKFGECARNELIDPKKAVLTPFHRELRGLSLNEMYDQVLAPSQRSWLFGMYKPSHQRHIFQTTTLLTCGIHYLNVCYAGRPVWKHWWAFPRLWCSIYVIHFAFNRVLTHFLYNRYESELQRTNLARMRFIARHDESAKLWNEPPRRAVKEEATMRPHAAGIRTWGVYPGDIPMPVNYSVYDPDLHLPVTASSDTPPQTFGGFTGDIAVVTTAFPLNLIA